MASDPRSALYVRQYQEGEWRARIFASIVKDEILSRPSRTVLDIGCGKGLDNIPALAEELSKVSDSYIGVEPDGAISRPGYVTDLHPHFLEEAELPPNSIDVAFCVMVLEHITDPVVFLKKIHSVLRPGGVFLGFTVDSRHWFPFISQTVETLRIKDVYLTLLHGRRGTERYENYPVAYKLNEPAHFATHAQGFSEQSFINFFRNDQMDYYFPRPVRPISQGLCSLSHRIGVPGLLLCVRLVK